MRQNKQISQNAHLISHSQSEKTQFLWKRVWNNWTERTFGWILVVNKMSTMVLNTLSIRKLECDGLDLVPSKNYLWLCLVVAKYGQHWSSASYVYIWAKNLPLTGWNSIATESGIILQETFVMYTHLFLMQLGVNLVCRSNLKRRLVHLRTILLVTMSWYAQVCTGLYSTLLCKLAYQINSLCTSLHIQAWSDTQPCTFRLQVCTCL